jgi:hypothetical protein
MAIDVFSIPPMSDKAERVFSCARRTVSWERSRLLLSTVETLELMGNWYRNGHINEPFIEIEGEVVDLRVSGLDGDRIV